MFFNGLYLLALGLISPVILYRRFRHGRYRRGIRQKLFGLSHHRAWQILGEREGSIWLHAVSVGEVNLLPQLVERLKAAYPDQAIAISSSTDTGYDLACKHFGDDAVFFCPLDFTWAVRRTLNRLRCRKLILCELELWPNLIATAAKTGCEVVVVNGRLSENSAGGYQRFSRLLKSTFGRLSHVGCQEKDAATRFVACGVAADRVTITGSLKFDNAPNSRDTPEVAQRINWSGMDAWHRVWCFGSTQEGEEAMGLRIYDRLRESQPGLRLILVPRHPERFDRVASLIQSFGFRVIRRSRDESQLHDVWDSDEVILIDTIGELRAWWGVSSLATVGGSFGNRGGQNMLEPAGYGSAVSFGPNTKNFDSIAKALIQSQGAVRVADEEELESFIVRCLDDIPAADALGRAAADLVASHRGAYERTMRMITGNTATFSSDAISTQKAA